MSALRPIRVSEHLTYPTVQKAVLGVLRMAEMRTPLDAASQLHCVLSELRAIRDSIVERAQDEEDAA